MSRGILSSGAARLSGIVGFLTLSRPLGYYLRVTDGSRFARADGVL